MYEKRGFGMYKISSLSNGIRVVSEYTDYVRSVALGVWVGTGSSMENVKNNGVSHYIEHMLFKGTKTRTAKEIAEFSDRTGSQLNALTAKKYTGYYAKTLTENLDGAIEILSDMLTNSVFDPECMETERRVIAEEINMSEDAPEDFVHDCLSKLMWRGEPLGFPIAGTLETLAGIDRTAILDYFGRRYCGENIVISVVGNFDEDRLHELLEKKFGVFERGSTADGVPGHIELQRGVSVTEKDIEQCHICLGLEGFTRHDTRRHALSVLNAVFGGSMSSRLFQSVREERGLAYSVYSYLNTYKNNGSEVIYAGVSPENTLPALEVISREIKRLKKEGLSADEIETAKAQLKASVVMSAESTSSRMGGYGRSVLLSGRVTDIEESISDIEAVDENAIAEAISCVFDINRLNIAAIGRIDGGEDRIKSAIDF